MEQYFTVFGQKKDDFTRFWASISTEKRKDGKGTGKYATANIQVRVSEDVGKLFEEESEKTKTKGIRMLRLKASEFYLMSAEPKDRDLDPYVYLFIRKAKAAESKEEEDD